MPPIPLLKGTDWKASYQTWQLWSPNTSIYQEMAKHVGETKRRHGLSKAVFWATLFRAAEDPKPCSILDSKCHIPIKLRGARHGSRADWRAPLRAFRKEAFSGKTALVFKDHFSWLAWCYHSGSALHRNPAKQNTAALHSLKASQHSGFHACLPDKERM